jgi:hypothetical protein
MRVPVNGRSNPIISPAVAAAQQASRREMRVFEIDGTHITPTEPISMSLRRKIFEVFIGRQRVREEYPPGG